MNEAIGPHTHVFGAPEIRSDTAPIVLAERFGWFWWYAACRVCAEARMCPAAGDLTIVRPEVPLDWCRWRDYPERYEIPAYAQLSVDGEERRWR